MDNTMLTFTFALAALVVCCVVNLAAALAARGRAQRWAHAGLAVLCLAALLAVAFFGGPTCA